MKFGICNLNTIPLRAEPSDKSEMVSQLLFGEHFKVLEQKKQWLYVKLAFDSYQGWVDEKQVEKITENTFNKLQESNVVFSNELLNFATTKNTNLISLSIGSILPNYKNNTFYINDTEYKFDGIIKKGSLLKNEIIETAFVYLNTPYLWGGKSPFGIDCSGFTQIVYRMNGYKLFRDASQQAKQGSILSFIEESEPGDLAFFDNDEGNIIHVGIILTNNYIIHASGKVRLDRLDQSGIYNEETNRHTHKLRMIRKIF
ncbi:MAG: C40 family peptidase [Flavobacteriaceae bacterium]|nr:C40 family peptidase [Flavobacteriaceae bacterium]